MTLERAVGFSRESRGKSRMWRSAFRLEEKEINGGGGGRKDEATVGEEWSYGMKMKQSNEKCKTMGFFDGEILQKPRDCPIVLLYFTVIALK